MFRSERRAEKKVKQSQRKRFGKRTSTGYKRPANMQSSRDQSSGSSGFDGRSGNFQATTSTAALDRPRPIGPCYKISFFKTFFVCKVWAS